MAENRVFVGLLSTARIKERIIPCIRDSAGAKVVAVASRNQQNADNYANVWNIPRANGSYNQLLADPDLDVIYIPLPNSIHVEWSVRCADAGEHLLCDKPLTITPEQVDQMAEAAEWNGVVIQEAVIMQFHQQTFDVQGLIAEGAIGDVRGIWVVFSYTLPQEHVYCSNESAPAWDAERVGSSGVKRLDLPHQNHPGVDGNVHVYRSSAVDISVTFGDSNDPLTKETLTYKDNNAYQDEVDAMVASVLDDTTPTLPLADSRANGATVVALLQSTGDKHPVHL